MTTTIIMTTMTTTGVHATYVVGMVIIPIITGGMTRGIIGGMTHGIGDGMATADGGATVAGSAGDGAVITMADGGEVVVARPIIAAA